MSDLSKSKRNAVITSVSGFGILLVVLGHSLGVPPDQAASIAEENPSYRIFYKIVVDFIYMFHMPLFFFISGFLYYYSSSNFSSGLVAFLAKKAQRLLIPYFLISTLVYPIKVLLSHLAMRPADFDLAGYLTSIFIPLQNSIIFFWFLPTLFLMMIVSWFLFRKSRYLWLDSTIILVSIVGYFTFDHYNLTGWASILNIGGVFHNYIFFASGFMACKYSGEWLLNSRTALVSFLPLVAFTVGRFMQLPVFFLEPAMILMAFSGIVASFSAAGLLVTWLQLPGRYSYQIYLLSWFPQTAIRILFGQMFMISIWLSVVLSLVTGLIIPIIVTRLLQKYDRSPIGNTFLQYR